MTIDDVIARLPVKGSGGNMELPPPEYDGGRCFQCAGNKRWSDGRICPRCEGSGLASTEDNPRIGLAVASMARHTTDEGWQLFQGLESAGYVLGGGLISTPVICGDQEWGHFNLSHVKEMLNVLNPSVVVLQDKREWVGKTAGPGFDDRERFRNVEALRARPDVFKCTIIKDAQNDAALHREAAEEMGVHAWVCYYNPKIVKALLPFLRERHLVRTWHSVDRYAVPEFSKNRMPGVVSGALSNAYPLRRQIVVAASRLGIAVAKHPGYGRNQCRTPNYLELLSHYKVAICTCSVYGYALRKLIEATACGCRVITNLPEDERLPLIDDNLVRVPDDIPMERLRLLIQHHTERWDAGFQEEMANRAKEWYDFRAVGKRLADDIETLRRGYNDGEHKGNPLHDVGRGGAGSAQAAAQAGQQD